MQLNALQTYRDAGAKAAKARWNHDESLAGEMDRWLSRALALEEPEYRKNARQVYDYAYRNASAVCRREMR